MLRMDDQDFKKLYWDGTSQMTYEDRKAQKFVQQSVDYRVILKLFVIIFLKTHIYFNNFNISFI